MEMQNVHSDNSIWTNLRTKTLNSLAAGADAGAGMQPHDDKFYISNDAISIAHSIALVRSTGVLVTRQQRMLKTPAGILTAMR
jgi:hypothetical protein